MKIDKLLQKIDYFEQRDIFAILVNMFSLDSEHQNEWKGFLDTLLDTSSVTLSDTLRLLDQDETSKKYYEKVLLDEISPSSQKFLHLVLEYIYNRTQSKIYKKKSKNIIARFIYDERIKDFIAEYTNNIKDKEILSVILPKDLINEILNNKIKPLIKEKTFLKNIQDEIAKNLAFSIDNGNYGIKKLSDGNGDTVHIFINGFTNDCCRENYKDWMISTKRILNQQDTFLGYDWASGKEPTSHILSLPNIDDLIQKPIRILKYIKGLNPFVVGGTVVAQTIAEWKHAKYNSEKYGEYLYEFIHNLYEKNNNIKINLYGHSLGANLIYNTLEYITDDFRVNNVYLFGGASLNCSHSWTHSLSVANNIFNFYSRNDNILKTMYQLIETGDEPIGLNPIKVKKITKLKMGTIYNYDVSSIINSHTEYISKIEELFYHCSIFKKLKG